MRQLRLVNRSLVAALVLATCGVPAAAQEAASVQKLLERGAFAEAVQRAEGERGNPESTYLAAQALAKMNEGGRASEEFNRLREMGDGGWREIGESGALLTQGDVNGAVEAATRAAAAGPDNPYAHYQLGLAAQRANNFARASEAFSRSVDLKPDLAYGHYYAGLAAQRLKQIGRMSEHFSAFLKLAPDAPEYAAVAASLRTLRPRR